MRIAIVFARTDVVGGVSVYIEMVAHELRARGHEVLLFCGAAGPATDRLDKVGLAWRPIAHLDRSLNVRANFRAMRDLERQLEEFAPDVIASQCANAGLLCRLLRNRLGVPIVHTPHGWPFAPGSPRLERVVGLMCELLVARATDAVIAVSAYDCKVALRHRVVHPDKVHIVHHGIADVPPRVRVDRVGNRCEIVMVARFEQQKDQETLLRALAQLAGLPWRLTFVGDGPRVKNMQRLARELQVQDRIRWLGTRNDVTQILDSGDVFVLSSIGESLPISIIEAMRSGLPAVASDVGGVSELIIDEVTGFLVPSRDVAALAAALRRLLEDDALRAHMGAASRRRFEECYTVNAMLEPTIDLLTAVACGTPTAMLRARGE